MKNHKRDQKKADQVPAIEPPCKDCEMVRAQSGNTQQWCSRHARHHVHGHAYGYEREHHLAQHDSNVVPTGTDPSSSRF